MELAFTGEIGALVMNPKSVAQHIANRTEETVHTYFIDGKCVHRTTSEIEIQPEPVPVIYITWPKETRR